MHVLFKMEFLKETVVFVGKLLWLCLIAFVKLFVPTWKKKDLTKEIVLVTGAGSGIGRLIALRYSYIIFMKVQLQEILIQHIYCCYVRFAEEGARVVLWDINTGSNNAVADEIKAKGGKADAYTCDCSKKEDIYKVADKVRVGVI